MWRVVRIFEREQIEAWGGCCRDIRKEQIEGTGGEGRGVGIFERNRSGEI